MPDSLSSAGASSFRSYRFPAEWEPCEAVWLAWPHNRDTWPGHFEPVPAAFAQFVRAIHESTPVRILATGLVAEDCRKHLQQIGLVESDSLRIVDVPTMTVGSAITVRRLFSALIQKKSPSTGVLMPGVESTNPLIRMLLPVPKSRKLPV